MAPLVKGTISITKDSLSKDSDKSAGIVAALLLMAITYIIYYYAGLFTIIN